MTIELLDTRANWAKIRSSNDGPFWKSSGTCSKLRATSGIHPLTSALLKDGTKTTMQSAFNGKSFYSKRN